MITIATVSPTKEFFYLSSEYLVKMLKNGILQPHQHSKCLSEQREAFKHLPLVTFFLNNYHFLRIEKKKSIKECVLTCVCVCACLPGQEKWLIAKRTNYVLLVFLSLFNLAFILCFLDFSGNQFFFSLCFVAFTCCPNIGNR